MRSLLVPAAGLAAAITLALTPSAPAAALAGAAPASSGTAAAAGTGAATGQAVRFWGYWQVKKSAWAFATTGPAQAKPEDGAVEGWRYAQSTGESGVPPRATPDFGKICGSERAEQGRKRVAVVLDYGDRSDAPQGQSQGPPAAKTDCAVVDAAATGADVLAAVARSQTDSKGLICAIDAYPAGACGQAQGAPAARAGGPATKAGGGSAAGERSGSPVGLIAGVVVVLAVAAAGVWLAVRRRTPGAPGQ